jgi:hypothetical protein
MGGGGGAVREGVAGGRVQRGRLVEVCYLGGQ